MIADGYNEPVDYHLPIDDLEPLENTADHVRDARVQAVMLLNRFAAQIEAALSRPGASNAEIATAFWGACYALGLNVCEGMSMTERALSLGIERATISKVATHFCRAAALEPSFYMKRAESQDRYRDARVRVVKESQR